MERVINPPSEEPKSEYLGFLEGIKSESNTTISSTTSGNLNSLFHLFESTVISVCEKKKFYMILIGLNYLKN